MAQQREEHPWTQGLPYKFGSAVQTVSNFAGISKVAGLLGKAPGLIGAIGTKLAGHGIPAVAARFATEAVVTPELQRVTSGFQEKPEESVLRRAGRGALTGAAMEIAGLAAAAPLAKSTLPGIAKGAITGGAVGAAAGAAMTPGGVKERLTGAAQDAVVWGLIGAAGANPFPDRRALAERAQARLDYEQRKAESPSAGTDQELSKTTPETIVPPRQSETEAPKAEVSKAKKAKAPVETVPTPEEFNSYVEARPQEAKVEEKPVEVTKEEVAPAPEPVEKAPEVARSEEFIRQAQEVQKPPDATTEATREIDRTESDPQRVVLPEEAKPVAVASEPKLTGYEKLVPEKIPTKKGVQTPTRDKVLRLAGPEGEALIAHAQQMLTEGLIKKSARVAAEGHIARAAELRSTDPVEAFHELRKGHAVLTAQKSRGDYRRKPNSTEEVPGPPPSIEEKFLGDGEVAEIADAFVKAADPSLGKRGVSIAQKDILKNLEPVSLKAASDHLAATGYRRESAMFAAEWMKRNSGQLPGLGAGGKVFSRAQEIDSLQRDAGAVRDDPVSKNVLDTALRRLHQDESGDLNLKSAREFLEGLQLAKLAEKGLKESAKLADEYLFDPDKFRSHFKSIVVDRGLSRVASLLDSFAPRLRFQLGLQSSNAAIRAVRDVTRAMDAEQQMRVQKFIADLATLPKKVQNQFLFAMSKRVSLPDNHPHKMLESEYRTVVDTLLQAQERVFAETGGRSGFGPEVRARFVRPGERGYVKNIPQFARDEKIPLRLRTGETIEDATRNRRKDPGEYRAISTRVQGVENIAKGAAKAARSATEHRETDYEPEVAFSHKVFLKDGRLIYGTKVEQNEKVVTLIEYGKKDPTIIPLEAIAKQEAPYVDGAHAIIQTLVEQGKFLRSLKTMEFIADNPALKRYIATRDEINPGKDRGWKQIPETPEWGVLQGKVMHHTLFNELQMLLKPEKSGWERYLLAASSTTKTAITLGRFPGHIVKQFLFEGPPMMALNGLQPEYQPAALKRSVQEARAFLETGKMTPGIETLLKRNLVHGGTHIQEITEGMRHGGELSKDPIEGARQEYVRNLLRDFTQNLNDRIDGLSRRDAQNVEETNVLKVSVEMAGAFLDTVNRVNPVQAVAGQEAGTIDVGGQKVEISGDGLKQLSSYIDLVQKLAVMNHVTEHGSGGIIRKNLRRAFNREQTLPTHEEVADRIYRTWDPTSLGNGLVGNVARYTFLRPPLMILREAVLYGGFTSPAAIAAFFFLKEAIGSIIDTIGSGLFPGFDREEAERQVARETYGDEDRAHQLIAFPMPSTDENGRTLIADFMAIDSNPFSGIPSRRGDEGLLPYITRAAAASAPLIGTIYEAATGRSPLSGDKDEYTDKLPGGRALQTAGSVLPFAQTAAQIARGVGRMNRQEEAYGMSSSTPRSIALQSLLGLGFKEGVPSWTKAGQLLDLRDRSREIKNYLLQEGERPIEVFPKPEDERLLRAYDLLRELQKRQKSLRSETSPTPSGGGH